MNGSRVWLYFLALVLAVFLAAPSASADIITFDSNPQFLGPPTFIGLNQDLTISGTSSGTVRITGGLVLTAASSVPATVNNSSIYGTAFFSESSSAAPGTPGAIVITFDQDIANFFVNLYNGFVLDDTFTIFDTLGHSVMATLPLVSDSGTTLVSFAAAGRQVTITTSNPSWDFFIDDIGFNEATPTPSPATVPEPSTLSLLATAGVMGLFVFWRRRGQQAQAIRSSR